MPEEMNAAQSGNLKLNGVEIGRERSGMDLTGAKKSKDRIYEKKKKWWEESDK